MTLWTWWKTKVQIQFQHQIITLQLNIIAVPDGKLKQGFVNESKSEVNNKHTVFLFVFWLIFFFMGQFKVLFSWCKTDPWNVNNV